MSTNRSHELALAAAAILMTFLAAGDCEAARSIDRRQDRQQTRIAHGIASGALTAGEAARLGRREAAIAREEWRMRQAHEGNLTPRNRFVLNHQLDRLSRGICRQKHDPQRRR